MGSMVRALRHTITITNEYALHLALAKAFHNQGAEDFHAALEDAAYAATWEGPASCDRCKAHL